MKYCMFISLLQGNIRQLAMRLIKLKRLTIFVLVRMQQDLNLSYFGGGINQLFFFFLPDLSSPAAAAAKSLQSCLTLCDPIDGSPPGSPVPGILQAQFPYQGSNPGPQKSEYRVLTTGSPPVFRVRFLLDLTGLGIPSITFLKVSLEVFSRL